MRAGASRLDSRPYWTAGLAVLLVGCSLRPQLAGIAPLFPEIQVDLDASHLAIGLLAAVPVAAMAAASFFGVTLVRLVPALTALYASLALLAVAAVCRAWVPTAPLLIAATLPIGLAVGIAGTMVPVVAGGRRSIASGTAVGLYSGGVQLGASLGALVAVPLAHALGGWRLSLTVLGLAIGATALAAWRLDRGRRLDGSPRALPASMPQPEPTPRTGSWTACLVVTVFALQSMAYFGLSSWLPTLYIERGWDPAAAGALVTVLNLAGLLTSFLIAPFVDRVGSRRQYMLFASGAIAVAVGGVLVASNSAVLWAAVAGIGLSVAFVIGLALPLDITNTETSRARMVGLTLGAGYLAAALAPLAMGALRDLHGDFVLGLWLIIALMAALAALSLLLSPSRFEPGGAQPAS